MTPLTTSTPSSRRDDRAPRMGPRPTAVGPALPAETFGARRVETVDPGQARARTRYQRFGGLREPGLLRQALAAPVLVRRAGAGRPPTSASSSWAMPCSASSWPSTATGAYPDFPEGTLAKVRAAVVNTAVLAQVAARLGVGDVLLLGRGEERRAAGPRPRSSPTPSRRSSAPSTSTAGWTRPRAFVLDPRRPDRRGGGRPGPDDFKTRLQEKAVRRVGARPATRWRARAPTTPAVRGRGASWPAPCVGAGRGTLQEGRRAGRPPRSACAIEPGKVDETAGRAMPELPEVETIRRDLDREVVGRKIKTVAVTATALGAPAPVGQAVPHPARGPHDQGSVRRRASTCW